MGNACSQAQECSVCFLDKESSEVRFDALAEDLVFSPGKQGDIQARQDEWRHSGLPRLMGSQNASVDQGELPKSLNRVAFATLWPLTAAITGESSPGTGEPARFTELVFDANGEEKKVLVYRRPLGADFKKRPFGHTKVSKVRPQSYAAELGLKEGWAIKAVDGQNMSKKTFEETQAAMMCSIEKLPQSNAD